MKTITENDTIFSMETHFIDTGKFIYELFKSYEGAISDVEMTYGLTEKYFDSDILEMWHTKNNNVHICIERRTLFS